MAILSVIPRNLLLCTFLMENFNLGELAKCPFSYISGTSENLQGLSANVLDENRGLTFYFTK